MPLTVASVMGLVKQKGGGVADKELKTEPVVEPKGPKTRKGEPCECWIDVESGEKCGKTYCEDHCGAKVRRHEAWCKKMPAKGSVNGRCARHGGKRARGPEWPGWRHGYRTRYENLPDRLTELYSKGVEDPKLIELRDEIAVVDARVNDMMSRVDSGESGDLWRMLKLLWVDMEAARSDADRDRALEKIGETIGEGFKDLEWWEDIGKWVDRRAKLCAVESKRMAEAEQLIPAVTVLNYLAQFVRVVREVVPDREIQKRIGNGIEGIFGKGTTVLIESTPSPTEATPVGRERIQA